MFENNKMKMIKTQQSLIESLKKKNRSLSKENELLKTKLLNKTNASEQDKLEFERLMSDLRDKDKQYNSLIKDVKDLKVQYSAYILEVAEIKEQYKNLFKQK